jgi:hypothetical protein
LRDLGKERDKIKIREVGEEREGKIKNKDREKCEIS